VIYLIEDFGSMKHMSLPAKSILQADVNTLLIDELIVHHTSDPKESAYYLIGLTHYIIEKYKVTKYHNFILIVKLIHDRLKSRMLH
jgi:hypothetical protein